MRVHGYQLLLDGVYNADPHPGNVIVLPDGRLGLIDYGMVCIVLTHSAGGRRRRRVLRSVYSQVGRLKPEERERIARTVLALEQGDVDGVAKIYADAGCAHYYMYDSTMYVLSIVLLNCLLT